jgi:hypothetical protein
MAIKDCEIEIEASRSVPGYLEIAYRKNIYAKTPGKISAFSYLKPQNHSTSYQTSTFLWHFSYLHSAIVSSNDLKVYAQAIGDSP